MQDSREEYYMRMAMQLALKAKGRTSPNPLVGAVLVKGGRVISTGFHKKAGSPHAEINAINKVTEDIKGSTLYVTLEPCSHFGRTPPCTERIIESGIKEVVVGMRDPNPLNNGKGLNRLRRAGIKLKVGILGKELREINRSFIKLVTEKMPYLVVKAGMSLDGRIATASGESKWITSRKSRNYARRMRGEFDAIMVGINTVLRDNPSLEPSPKKSAYKKIIIDRHLKTPATAKVFRGNSQVIIVSSIKNSPARASKFKDKAVILPVEEKAACLDLKEAMRKLAGFGIASILVEGGGELIGSLFDEHLVDRVIFFVAPKIIGGREALGAVMGKGISRISKAHRLENLSVEHIGADLLIQADVEYQ